MPTVPTEVPEVRCNACGSLTTTDQPNCPSCGQMLNATLLLDRLPRTMPSSNHGIYQFGPRHQVMIQLLPSGACLTLPLSVPTVLGRIRPPGDIDFVDLSPYNASQHGVSRQHCRLERGYDQLFVIDLSSTNGTHLNTTRLPPYEEYTLAHGDKLILGTLHIMVSFA